jgi:hypothetical protein
MSLLSMSADLMLINQWDAATGVERYDYSGYKGTQFPVSYHRDDIELQ